MKNDDYKDIIVEEYIRAFLKDFLLFSVSNVSYTFLDIFQCPILLYKQYILKHKDKFTKRMFFGKVVHYIYELILHDKENLDKLHKLTDDEFNEYIKKIVFKAIENVLDEYISVYSEEVYYSDKEVFKYKLELEREQLLPYINEEIKKIEKNKKEPEDIVLVINKSKRIQFNLYEYLKSEIFENEEKLNSFINIFISKEFLRFISQKKTKSEFVILVEPKIIFPNTFVFLNVLKSAIVIPDILIYDLENETLFVIDTKVSAKIKREVIANQLLWYMFNIVNNFENKETIINYNNEIQKISLKKFILKQLNNKEFKKDIKIKRIIGFGFLPKINSFVKIYDFKENEFDLLFKSFCLNIIKPIKEIYESKDKDFNLYIFLKGLHNKKKFIKKFNTRNLKDFTTQDYKFRSDILEVSFSINYKDIDEDYFKIYILSNKFKDDENYKDNEKIKEEFLRYIEEIKEKFINKFLIPYLENFENMRLRHLNNPNYTSCERCNIKQICSKDKERQFIEEFRKKVIEE